MNSQFYKRAKRFIDLLAGLVILGLLSPVLLVTCLCSLILLGFPIFFTQERAGYKGQVFRIYKFRSMTDECDEHGNLLPNEQRITRYGSFLRKFSIDEIPALFNVLNGKMSLVGPRPLRVHYLDLYNEHHARRHDMLPGVTGLAQVSGRNSLSWQRRLDLDIDYVDTASFWLDIKILFLTVLKVFGRADIDNADGVGMTPFVGYDDTTDQQ